MCLYYANEDLSARVAAGMSALHRDGKAAFSRVLRESEQISQHEHQPSIQRARNRPISARRKPFIDKRFRHVGQVLFAARRNTPRAHETRWILT